MFVFTIALTLENVILHITYMFLSVPVRGSNDRYQAERLKLPRPPSKRPYGAVRGAGGWGGKQRMIVWRIEDIVCKIKDLYLYQRADKSYDFIRLLVKMVTGQHIHKHTHMLTGPHTHTHTW